MILTVLTLLTGIIILFHVFLTWNFDYWKKRGVNGPKPIPFVGSFPGVFTKKNHIAIDMKKIYEYVISYRFVLF